DAAPLPRAGLRRDRRQCGWYRDRRTSQRVPSDPEAQSSLGGRPMTRHDDTLVAMLLGDAPATPAVRRRLAGDAGARSRRARSALDALYGDARVQPAAHPDAQPPARPMVYWDSLDALIGRVLVAVSDAGVVRIAFRRSAASFVAELAQQLGAEAV